MRQLLLSGLVAATLLTFGADAQQPVSTPSIHAKQNRRLIIRNAMIIYGNAKPAYGPMDILVEDGRIATITASGERLSRIAASANDAVIDAAGKYVMPGIVNAHMHWHEERQPGVPQPIQYERNLYLAAGVTTAREVGGDFEKTKQWRAESAAHKIVAPRIVLYPMLANLQQGPTLYAQPARYLSWLRSEGRVQHADDLGARLRGHGIRFL